MSRARHLIPASRLAAVAAAALLALVASAGQVTAADEASLLKDMRPGGSSNPTGLTRSGDIVFFAANDGTRGVELWRSDGTKTATRLVRDIRPGARGSKPSHITNVNGVVYFSADDGVHGRELWRSDGTRTGTHLVRDLSKPTEFGDGTGLGGLTAVGGRLFFFASVPGPGIDSASLWVSDGTKAGTRSLWSGQSARATAGMRGFLYFIAEDFVGSRQLWVSDGTRAGTRRVPGTPDHVIGPLTRVDRRLYFFRRVVQGGDGYYSQRTTLWKTDGTAAGTQKLLRLGDLEPEDLRATAFDGKLYFVNGTQEAQQVWKSNGKVNGTRALTAFGTGWIGELAAVGSRLFFSRSSTETDHELWVSDGRPAGTTKVISTSRWIRDLTRVGGQLAFVEGPDWDTRPRPWTLRHSDGTADGTTDVASFVRAFGSGESLPRVTLRGTLLFAADDGTGAGRELWTWRP